MKTIFGLFRDFEDARSAVYELRNRGMDEEGMNVIVHENRAKNYLGDRNVNLATANVDVTDAMGEVELESIDRLIAGRRPVHMPGVGNVYAVGDLANMLVKTAAVPGEVGGRMEVALADMGVPANIAEVFLQGVKDGAVLFWIRVDDTAAAQTTSTLIDHHAEHVGSYMVGQQAH